MNLVNAVEPIPLSTNADGVVLITGTRIPLDTVIFEFKQGATAEEIAYQYPSLELADVYAVIAYYLRHRGEVETYLQEQEQLAVEVRQKVEEQFPSMGLKERLLIKHQHRVRYREN